MLAGVALFTKLVHPGVKVIGVEAADAAAMKLSLAEGCVTPLDSVGVFADGAAVKTVGTETFRIISDPQYGCDGVVAVSNDEICAAIKDIFEDTRGIVEGAGALSVAGMMKYVGTHGLEGKRVVCVTSGANMNFSRLRFVAERAALGERREALLAVIIPEKPGAFRDMHCCLAPLSITEFSYRFREGRDAILLVGLEVAGPDCTKQAIERLNKSGMPSHNVTGMGERWKKWPPFQKKNPQTTSWSRRTAGTSQAGGRQ